MIALAKRLPRSNCPIATTLDLVGDRWSLIIIRDMMNGKSRFGDFLKSPEHITTNVLTDRLAVMEQMKLVRKTPYQRKPLRFDYVLTERGMSLLPVLQEICRWANRHFPKTRTPPKRFMKLTVDDLKN